MLTPEQQRMARATAEARRAARRERGVPGLRDAATAMCIACIVDPLAGGTWVAQVRACTSPGCPLYPHRPGARDVPLPDDYSPRTAAAVLAEARRTARIDDADDAGDDAAEAQPLADDAGADAVLEAE